MAEERVVQTSAGPAAPAPVAPTAEEPSLGELFHELAQESSTLIRQEVALARAEMRQSFKALSRYGTLLAVGGAISLLGALTLTAFLVVGLGKLLDGEYWLAALIVGVLYALIGGALLMRGKNGLQHEELKPDRTIESLQEDRRWATAEARQVKRDLTS